MEKIKYYSLNLGISFLIAIIFLFITATIFTYTNINDRYLNMFVFAILALSVFLGSILALRKIKKRGLLYGAIFGIIYLMVLYLFTVIAYKGFFITNTLGIHLLICLLSGTLGGIIGVNL